MKPSLAVHVLGAAVVLTLLSSRVAAAAETKQDKPEARDEEPKVVVTNNRTLRELYTEDQDDRKAASGEIDWSKVAPRDDARRAAVSRLLKKKQLKSSDDYLHAAMIFQHGPSVEDARTAHELSLRAVELDKDNREARWLAAAAKDRELMRLGKPQLYGTQFHKAGGGQWELYPVDPTVTDEERARWDVPPLAEARARAVALNVPPPTPATPPPTAPPPPGRQQK
jgi:hypothetical protein